MKPLTPLFLLLPALASAQIGFRDNKGDVSVRANDGTLVQESGGRILRFDLVGAAKAVSKLRRIDMSATRMKGTIESGPGGTRQLGEFTAFGPFTLDRTITESLGERVTKIRSTGATYTTPSASTATVDLKANAVIIDDAAGRDVDLRGNSGTANLTVGGANATLQKATLRGNVKIKVVQAVPAQPAVPAVGSTPARAARAATRRLYNASGDLMVYDKIGATGRAATITLTGNLKFDSPDGEGGGIVEGANQAVITLNGAGEVASVQLSSGKAFGVKTTIRPAKKKG